MPKDKMIFLRMNFTRKTRIHRIYLILLVPLLDEARDYEKEKKKKRYLKKWFLFTRHTCVTRATDS